MEITILNGNANAKNSDFEQFLAKMCVYLDKEQHVVHHLKLRAMDIRYCIGCWSCWVKTPGKCSVKDESHTVCDNVINSDLTIFASPVIMGFTSEILKRAQDKLIPLVHPYIEMVQGECHHKKRYDKYPKLGLLLHKDDQCDDEDVSIITDIYKRLALNLKSELRFTAFSNDPVEEVMNEISNL